MTSKRSPIRRLLVASAVIAGLAGITVGAIAVAHRSSDGEAPTTTEPPRTAKAALGDLTTTVSLDGSVELSDTTVVVHRIDGATSSGSSAAAASGNPGASTGSSSSPTGAAPQALVAADCTSAPTTDAAVPTGPADTTTTTTTTTVPDDSSTPVADSTTTTTTVVATTVDPSTATTVCPTDPGATTTTVPTGSSGPTGGAPTGGAPTGGAVSGAAPSAAGSGSSGGTTQTQTQTLTSIVAAGTSIGLGDVLYTVDGTPVVALHGALPAWRTMSTSSSDGPDIAQLEQSLVDLGYDPDGLLTVDSEFDSATKKIVKRWQTGLGLEATGEVTLGSVVFLPIDGSVASVSVAVGDDLADGDRVLDLAGPAQQVVVDVPEEDRQLVLPGAEVTVGDTTGTVTLLRSSDESGAVAVQAIVVPSAPIAGAVGGTTVKVKITTEDATGVVVVPVQAIASRLDGSYAVQVVDGAEVEWVTVEVVGQSGTKVGVVGDGISDGTELVVPASS